MSEWSTRTRNTTAGGSIAATVEKCFAARFRVVGRTWTLSDMLGRQSSGSASPGKEYGRGWVDGSSPGAAAGSRKEARSIGTAGLSSGVHEVDAEVRCLFLPLWI